MAEKIDFEIALNEIMLGLSKLQRSRVERVMDNVANMG